jgi:lipopolysaccharide/colanic/teichoic acid biosynthesis glycosyltransferase
MYKLFGKRLLDIAISLVVLLLLSPVILITWLVLIYLNEGKPFFFQERPGQNEKPFKVIKFKSMNDKKDPDGKLLPDNIRLTPFGKFIRSSSIDELPQLFNVLLGSMSLVGPRPLLFKYIPLYSEEQRKRHLAKPGITGLAQVSGRNSIPWHEKFKHDVYYVSHLSFFLDLKILWKTFLKVIIREGVNQSNERPMMPFDGNN